jgi:hypothetical protein
MPQATASYPQLGNPGRGVVCTRPTGRCAWQYTATCPAVFEAIHLGRSDPELLAYQYLQTLPKIASGDGNHTWLIPSELTRALDALASGFGDRRTQAAAAPAPSITTPHQVTPTAPAPAPPTNGHTGPTGRRGSKRTAGTQQEGEPDRLSAGRSTPEG